PGHSDTTIRRAAAGQGLPAAIVDRRAWWCVAHLMSRRWLGAVSVAAHLCILIGGFTSGIWRLERLEGVRAHGPCAVQPLPPPARGGGPRVPKAPELVHKAPGETARGRRQPTPRVDTTPQPGPEIAGIGPGPGPGPPDSPGTCTENCGDGPPAQPVCGNGSVE